MIGKRSFDKNAVIFTEGSAEKSMYDIIEGKVGIYANYGTENESLLTELGPGKYFGEMAIIECMPRSATAVALEYTEVNVINYKEFDQYIVENPDKIIDIFQNLCGRLRELSNEYVDACRCVTEYVETEKADRPLSKRLIDKIKKLIQINEEYASYANQAMVDGYQSNPFYYGL